MLQTIQKSDAFPETIGNFAECGSYLKPLPPTFLLPVAFLAKPVEQLTMPQFAGLEKSLVGLLHELFALLYKNLIQVRASQTFACVRLVSSLTFGWLLSIM